jgi:hypothetical protein
MRVCSRVEWEPPIWCSRGLDEGVLYRDVVAIQANDPGDWFADLEVPDTSSSRIELEEMRTSQKASAVDFVRVPPLLTVSWY